MYVPMQWVLDVTRRKEVTRRIEVSSCSKSNTNASGIGRRNNLTRIYGETPKNLQLDYILHLEIQRCIRQIQDLI